MHGRNMSNNLNILNILNLPRYCVEWYPTRHAILGLLLLRAPHTDPARPKFEHSLVVQTPEIVLVRRKSPWHICRWS